MTQSIPMWGTVCIDINITYEYLHDYRKGNKYWLIKVENVIQFGERMRHQDEIDVMSMFVMHGHIYYTYGSTICILGGNINLKLKPCQAKTCSPFSSSIHFNVIYL